MFSFDFRSRTWTQLGSSHGVEVQTRYRHEMVLYENRLYLFGGGTTDLERDCELKTVSPTTNLANLNFK